MWQIHFNKKFIPMFGMFLLLPFGAWSLIACGTKSTRDFSKYRRDFSQIDWTKYNYVDATVNSWRDGDTPEISYLQAGQTYTNIGLRIRGIDTPEAHVQNDAKQWVETTGIEWKLAHLGWDFAKAKIPTGAKVRIAITAGKSYNRIVGSLFYGKKFQKNFSVELLARGYANPFLNGVDGFSERPSDIYNEIALPIADAFNYAYNQKLGVFSATNIAAIAQGVHGTTNFNSVTYDPEMSNIFSSDNVYFELKMLKTNRPKRRL